jgi:5-methylcytosine-specific restriction endonuclease McrA
MSINDNDNNNDNNDTYSKFIKRVKIIGTIALIIFLLWVFLDKVSAVIKFSNSIMHISYYIIPLLTLAWFKFYKKDKTPVIINNQTVDTTDFVDDLFTGMKSFYQSNFTNNKPPTINKLTKQLYNSNKNSQGRCVNNTMKKVVASNQKWECGLCQNLLDASYEVDHIIPLYKGGSNNITNLMALCRNCHGMKTINDQINYYN